MYATTAGDDPPVWHRVEDGPWIAEEEPRIILAIVSTFSFGTVALKLKNYSVGVAP